MRDIIKKYLAGILVLGMGLFLTSYAYAEKALGRDVTDKEAYKWLEQNGHSEYDLPSFSTWRNYLSKARGHHNEKKNNPRAGRNLPPSTIRASDDPESLGRITS